MARVQTTVPARRRIAAEEFAAALEACGAGARDAVFLHSDVRRCGRAEGRAPREKLDTVLHGLAAAVPDGVLVLPTFTYSFTRGEPFDVEESPSTVGGLGERFRALPGVRRTPEPIFSTALRGELEAPWEERLMAVGDKDCFGPESVFAWLVERDGLIAFLDVPFQACTFVHHVEQRLEVPYRYRKVFAGEVRAGAERRHVRAHYLVRHLDQDVVTDAMPLWGELVKEGVTRSAQIPGGPGLDAVRARAVLEVAGRRMAENPDFLLERGHRREPRPQVA
jgi:aminoglycoside 3-N-acetyltransferase